jgi:hypothetical protein
LHALRTASAVEGPHGAPSSPNVIIMHVFDPDGPLQARPTTPAHPALLAPQAAPAVDPAIMQVPAPMLTVLSAATQLSPALHVCPSQGWPTATSAWHVRGLPTQV